MAIGGGPSGVQRTLIGYQNRPSLVRAITAEYGQLADVDWCPDLRIRCQGYFSGTPDDFQDVEVAATWGTPFQRNVIESLRRVPFGGTTTYAELARRAGRPGAARAVGQVMASNPVPLFVPCHRVLASGGRLGGFSAPTGIVLKQRLLELEASALMLVGSAG